MGVGIAEVCARGGLDVIVIEADAARAEDAHERLAASLATAIDRGKLASAGADTALERVTTVTEFECLSDRELVVEAVVEDRDVKLAVFRRLAEIVDAPEPILCSNTTSIPIVELATAAGQMSAGVVGLHFFNPVPVMDLVEVIPSLLTKPETVERVVAFARDRLGKDPILSPDRAGFTVSALLIPYLLSAIRMVEQGQIGAEDIDKGMVKACAHPMGPLALADLIGLDTVMAAAETLYAEHCEPCYAPPPMLRRLVSAGLLGRKSKHGIYNYT